MGIRRAQRGFTLMEILLAFVVLAAAVGMLYRTFSTGLRNVGAVATYSEAISVAEARLTGLGLEKPLEEGEESGATEDRRFNWRVVVQPYTAPGSAPEQAGGFVNPQQLLRATVTVTWDEQGDHRRTIALSTVRLVAKAPA
jgi:general secretion pathway protein I